MERSFDKPADRMNKRVKIGMISALILVNIYHQEFNRRTDIFALNASLVNILSSSEGSFTRTHITTTSSCFKVPTAVAMDLGL